METVPQIISTKDLSYISDMFNWNYNAYKQIRHYITEIERPDIKELLEAIANMHYHHLTYLISILKGETVEEYDEEDENNEG